MAVSPPKSLLPPLNFKKKKQTKNNRNNDFNLKKWPVVFSPLLNFFLQESQLISHMSLSTQLHTYIHLIDTFDEKSDLSAFFQSGPKSDFWSFYPGANSENLDFSRKIDNLDERRFEKVGVGISWT